MAEDFLAAAVKRIEEQFAGSGVEECFETFEEKEDQITMRDGVKLHTIYYFPKMQKKANRESVNGEPVNGKSVKERPGNEKPEKEELESERLMKEQHSYPVILTRTCYPGNDQLHRAYGEGLARRGYVYVYQYCRGRETSEGKWEPNINERNDGIDTMNYLVEQPWCENLGYWGHSYTALTGWAFADAAEGKVAAMFLEDYGTDRFVSAYEKGCFRHDILTSWSMGNAEKPVDADYRKSCRYLPQIEVDEAMWGQKVPSYREYITSPNPDDALWQTGWWKQLREIPAKTKVPIYLLSGWYDHHHGSSMKTWERLNEETKQHSWLEIGAWNHFFQICLEDKEVQNPQNEEIPKMLEWFELTLKRKEIPSQRIRAYEIGADRWIDTVSDETGTKDGTGSITLYLDDKELKEKASDREKTRSYIFDPENPVESLGGEALLHTMPQIGSRLQPETDYREDVKSFVSAPLEKPLRLNGKASVKLFVSTDCEDTAFTAKIMEVTPEGKAYNIRSSITTLEQGIQGEKEYKPGSVAEVEIEMWNIVYTIPEGSRVRVDISSSDFPQYHVHSNQKGLWSEQTENKIAHQTIHMGGVYPSCVILPEKKE